jgi:hypothetical protein
MDAGIKKLWAGTEIRLWPETYVLVSLPHKSLAGALTAISSAAGHFSAVVVEKDEVSLTVEEGCWGRNAAAVPFSKADGPYRVVTLQLNVDLGVTGYLAPAAVRLAEAGISIVLQCAFLKDHLLIRAADAERAVNVLGQLARECRDEG